MFTNTIYAQKQQIQIRANLPVQLVQSDLFFLRSENPVIIVFLLLARLLLCFGFFSVLVSPAPTVATLQVVNIIYMTLLVYIGLRRSRREGVVVLFAVPETAFLVWEPAGADSAFFIGSCSGGFAALGEVGSSIEPVES
jgi:uncharacterized membrane protein